MAAYRYNYAIVSRIADTFKDNCSTKKGTIDLEKARFEHENLVESLRKIGLDVLELPSDDRHPDGLFVDDTAVVINGIALVCSLHKAERKGEVCIVRQVLKKELGLKIVEIGDAKAEVEGGDVLFTGKEIFVGLSKNTNPAGAQAVAKAFPEYPTTTVTVHEPAIHLKNLVCMAGPNVMAVGRGELAQKTFKTMMSRATYGYKIIYLDEDNAAEVIYANGNLLHLSDKEIPKSYGIFEKQIENRMPVCQEEVSKAGGALGSCVLLIQRIKHPKKITSTLP